MGRYTFGTSQAAAERLALLAEALAPTTGALLAEALGAGRDLVADLGCGPGHTTRLIQAVCRPATTLGLDTSEQFVRLAESLTVEPGVRFAVHSATDLPLPEAPYDGLYARFLLAHLPDALALARDWCGQVRPGGVVVLEETETIEAPTGVLRDYEDLAGALVRSEGGVMCAGPLLAPLGGRCSPVAVAAPRAARIYGLNLESWGDEAVRLGLADPADVERIAAGLAAIDGGTVTWVIRQVVLPV